MAKVSAVTIFPTVVDVLCASGFSDVSVVPAVVVVTTVAGFSTVVWLMVILLLLSPCSCFS